MNDIIFNVNKKENVHAKRWRQGDYMTDHSDGMRLGRIPSPQIICLYEWLHFSTSIDRSVDMIHVVAYNFGATNDDGYRHTCSHHSPLINGPFGQPTQQNMVILAKLHPKVSKYDGLNKINL